MLVILWQIDGQVYCQYIKLLHVLSANSLNSSLLSHRQWKVGKLGVLSLVTWWGLSPSRGVWGQFLPPRKIFGK